MGGFSWAHARARGRRRTAIRIVLRDYYGFRGRLDVGECLSGSSLLRGRFYKPAAVAKALRF
jgi:hypothetical protein